MDKQVNEQTWLTVILQVQDQLALRGAGYSCVSIPQLQIVWLVNLNLD